MQKSDFIIKCDIARKVAPRKNTEMFIKGCSVSTKGVREVVVKAQVMDLHSMIYGTRVCFVEMKNNCVGFADSEMSVRFLFAITSFFSTKFF